MKMRTKRIDARELRQIILSETRLTDHKYLRRTLASYLLEDADSEKIDPDLYPSRLSKVRPDLAKALSTTGQGNLDKVKAGPASKAANEMKASQTTMDFGKFIGMAIQMMGKLGNFSGGAGGDLGAVISNDLHIMDGHHRWAATLMVNPSATVAGIGIDLPGEKLVGVLNVWTIAHGGKGKPSDTNLAGISGDDVAQGLKKMVEEGNKWLPGPDKILEAFKSNGFDSIEAAAAHVKKNWDATSNTREIKGWMPAKIDMPAIEPDQLKTVSADISTGKMDLNPDYSPEVNQAMSNKKESRLRSDQLVMERWLHLAGLLKG